MDVIRVAREDRRVVPQKRSRAMTDVSDGHGSAVLALHDQRNEGVWIILVTDADVVEIAHLDRPGFAAVPR